MPPAALTPIDLSHPLRLAIGGLGLADDIAHHLVLDGNGNEQLDLFSGVPREEGDDLYLDVGDVRISLNGQTPESGNADSDK